jgi:hypothetical protein
VRTALFASLALALSGCGDPLFFAEVEDRRICMTLPGESIPAAPAGVGDQTVTWQGRFDLGSGIPGLGEKGTTGTIRMVSFSLASTTDVTSITHAEVDLTSDAGPPTPFMHYTQQQPVADPNSLSMAIDQDLDLFERLAGGRTIGYAIAFTGRPPTAAWTADITACMSAKVKIDPLQVIKK